MEYKLKTLSPLKSSYIIRITDASLERGRIVLKKVENTLDNVAFQLDAVH